MEKWDYIEFFQARLGRVPRVLLVDDSEKIRYDYARSLMGPVLKFAP